MQAVYSYTINFGTQPIQLTTNTSIAACRLEAQPLAGNAQPSAIGISSEMNLSTGAWVVRQFQAGSAGVAQPPYVNYSETNDIGPSSYWVSGASGDSMLVTWYIAG